MSDPNPKVATGADPTKPAVPAEEVSQFDELGVVPTVEDPIEVTLEDDDGGGEPARTPVEAALDEPIEAAPGGGQEPAAPAEASPVVAELESRVQQLEADRVQQQGRALDERYNQLEQADAEAAKKDTDELETIKSKMEQAYEKGDTKLLASLNIESTRVVQRMTLRENTVKARKVQYETVKKRMAADGAQQTQPTNPKATVWVSRNKWFNDPRFANETAQARRIDAALDLEGYDKGSDEYYAELDARLKKRFPKLSAGQAEPGNGGQRRPTGGPAPAVQQAQRSSRPGSGGKVVLDSNDFRVMRRFGMDPKNATHVKQYAREKRQREQNETRRQS